jgi:cytochrome c-type biogenesis protein
VVTIVLGLIFMGAFPALQRQFRLTASPAVGVGAAPLLGVVFGIGWTPCIGPTLAAVQTLSFTSATAERGALLSLFYCLGLGLPFLIAGLAYGRAMTAFTWVRQHSVWVMRFGGGLLVLLGVLLVTGIWQTLSIELLTWVSQFETSI